MGRVLIAMLLLAGCGKQDDDGRVADLKKEVNQLKLRLTALEAAAAELDNRFANSDRSTHAYLEHVSPYGGWWCPARKDPGESHWCVRTQDGCKQQLTGGECQKFRIAFCAADNTGICFNSLVGCATVLLAKGGRSFCIGVE